MADGKGGLQSAKARRPFGLVLLAVRRVVGGDGVDSPVIKRGDNRLTIGFSSQRRVYPAESGIPHAAGVVFGRADVVGRRFAGEGKTVIDGETFFLPRELFPPLLW